MSATTDALLRTLDRTSEGWRETIIKERLGMRAAAALRLSPFLEPEDPVYIDGGVAYTHDLPDDTCKSLPWDTPHSELHMSFEIIVFTKSLCLFDSGFFRPNKPEGLQVASRSSLQELRLYAPDDPAHQGHSTAVRFANGLFFYVPVWQETPTPRRWQAPRSWSGLSLRTSPNGQNNRTCVLL
ncbi:hypothetical protein E2F48_11610 [Arthrobacter crusticola]|uniref:Uncharacterized protein n=1 Tax=Arthrobacter crusticola TaxID=2547960 RepID=A0A4V3AM76_9MICC|nr:hypothetical protein [Arthrobacter crusticola]TDK25859.1 hypothetical protein E2F48_11610 [Arthrobacter crusticola]